VSSTNSDGTAPAGARALPSGEGIRMIAAREIRERTRSRSFRIVTVVLIAIGIGAVAIPAATSSSSAPLMDVGLVGTYPAALQRTMTAVGGTVGIRVHLVQEADLAAAQHALRTGGLDLAVVDGRRLLVNTPIDQPTSDLGRLTAGLSRAIGLSAALSRAGLPPDKAERALDAPSLPVATLQHVAADIGKRKAIAYIGLLFLYISLVTYGGWVAVGVLEEKSSRIVEILLSTVRPATLLAGKVIGIGVCGLLQFGAITVAALITSNVVGTNVLPSGSSLALLSALMWFTLGFAFYSSLYAAAGSLGSKPQDAQAVAAPLQILLLVVYFVGTLTALNKPDSALIQVLSFFPPTAPMTMSVRAIVGNVPWWQIVISVALTVGATVFLIRLAGRVYAHAILRTGPRLKLRQAWREASEPGSAAEA
jgi:ABC-2 type transport system permease protein